MSIHLQSQNWRDYIRSDNPVAAALLSEMGYKKEERVEVKMEFLRMITRMKLDPAKQRLISSFFESYLKLTEEEEEILMSEVKKSPDVERILELPISYEEKGKVIGVKKVALEMLKKELDLNLIAEVTHLDIEKIEKLREQL